jgi:hypothetical protein
LLSCNIFSTIFLSEPRYKIAKLDLIEYRYFMENIDGLNEGDIIKESEEAIKSFWDSLGKDDIYKEILFEELFKLLLKRGK